MMKNILKSTKWYILLVLTTILFSLSYFFFLQQNYLHITAKFKEFRPVHEKIDVFYKGLKIGYVQKMELCEEHKNTLVRCVLTYKDLHLPENVEAYLKKEKKNDKEFDLIEIVYPSNPSSVLLSDNSIINGVLTVDIETFMKNQNPEHLASIKENLIQSTENLEYALNALADLFVTLDEIAKQNKKNIYQSTYNLSKTTNDTQQIMNKLNHALNEQELNNSLSSLNKATKNISSMTTDVYTTTLPQVNSTLYQTECLVASVNEIVCGLKEDLKKRFSGIRLLFGKTID